MVLRGAGILACPASASGPQEPQSAKDHRPVTELKSNIPLVFNKCSCPRLDIRNSAVMLRAVNRANHERPCKSSRSNGLHRQAAPSRGPQNSNNLPGSAKSCNRIPYVTETKYLTRIPKAYDLVWEAENSLKVHRNAKEVDENRTLCTGSPKWRGPTSGARLLAGRVGLRVDVSGWRERGLLSTPLPGPHEVFRHGRQGV